MPYVAVKLPVCNRCYHVWLPDLEPGEKSARLINFKYVAGKLSTPGCCPKCKSPYWNIRRKYKKRTRARARKPRSTPDQMASAANAMSVAEIFEKVMKTVKDKTNDKTK